ncbi:serine/threonine-protein kinase gcn2 [Hypoxylon rubiginosum]|uniref:Serine/threonine-protein kinase gcn2 n=1 Tax=Hypoxylon rubiginosum TaxID=110542 RepID=A0ACC0DDZ4_9PEZI|nr:serine/threonine-protein kinase gcn2 [Hypoxylon rubiginosum]
MAWKPSGPWKAPRQLTTKTDDSRYPGLTPASPETGPKTQYLDVQNDEIIVLQAIYGDDYIEHKAANSAWQKSEPSFDIRIKALSDEEVAVTLSVVLTATYPKSAPLLSLKDDGNLKESTVFKLQKFIETKPKALIVPEQPEPIIHELAQGLQDILEDAAQAKAQGLELPSLEDERAAHEAELARQAREQEEEEERKKQNAMKEEERVMQDMIQKEVDRQRAKVKESKIRNRTLTASNHHSQDSRTLGPGNVEFDQECKVTDRAGNVFLFNTVTGRKQLEQGQIAIIYSVRPETPGSRDGPSLALKEFELRTTTKETAQFKKRLQALEGQLESIKKISHRNVVDLLNFRIDRDHGESDSASIAWIARLLTPLAERGSLEELLQTSTQLGVGKVRSWTADLLDALGYLHSHGFAHQDLHPNNVLLFKESTGDVIPKLSDVAYQREMHSLCRRSQKHSWQNSARSTYWLPPEIADSSRPQYTQKTDVWDLGVIFLQMIFGLDVFQKYQSPGALMDSLSLSRPLRELVDRFFKLDPKKRPRAFELSSSEFLATDAPIIIDDTSTIFSPSHSLSSLSQAFPIRSRRESSARGPTTSSRYTEDFVEEARLGKGGFGEVVKARKKLDGQIYAIKKITQRSQASLTEILKEVRLLSQLSHPAVVRYYNTWLEEIPDMTDTEEDTSTEDFNTGSKGTASQEIDIQFTTSTGGLDFISSSHPNIEFGYDDSDVEDEEESEDEDSESDTNSVVNDSIPSPTKSRSSTRHSKTVMYISMEYCEKKTLRDLIQRHLWKDTEEVWRLFRQILEGLVHIHGLNIVHRDLKPDNIFIGAGPDGVNNVKIGDFGLATAGQFAIDKAVASSMDTSDLTRSIGTSYYVAPEVKRTGGGSYTSKVDMYSLGIMFFEMCYHPIVGMERADKLGKLGNSSLLPDDFQPSDKVKSDIVLSLVTHDVKERPSSIELLRSGKLPVPRENETTRKVLASLKSSGPASPYYPAVASGLFEAPLESTKDYAFDMATPNPSAAELLYQEIVEEELISVFHRHGAVKAPRSSLYPRSNHYPPNQNTVKLLHPSGTVVQLPYDLMLGKARFLAKHGSDSLVRKSFTFGSVYRDRQNGSQPLVIGEVDFDIVSTDTLDLALKEAEVIKVLDEIIDTFPLTTPMCFHLGHSDLLQLIFDFCNVDLGARKLAAEALSKLNIHSHNFQKIRQELRSSMIGISDTSVDDLRRFDFRDTPAKAFAKLESIFKGSQLREKLKPTLAHLKGIVEYTERLGVHAKIYINPLSSVKEHFFSGGMLFQCIYDKKVKDVFAAGGRYDSLVKAHRATIGEGPHVVGFSLAWEKLARLPKSGKFLKKPEDEVQGVLNANKRCDVLVSSFDADILRTAGIELLSMLWSNNISAELARDARSQEELITRNRDETYSWIVIIKQDNVLKVKTMDRKEVPDVEISTTQLLAWLRAALRERGTAKQSDSVSSATPIAQNGGLVPNANQAVRVLVAGTRSKKFNRHMVVEQAQTNAAALQQASLEGPIAAVETSDTVLELIQNTALSEPESWRRAEQRVDKNERRYLGEIHDMLLEWRADWENKDKDGCRHAFVYNFRTTKCIYYDLGN